VWAARALTLTAPSHARTYMRTHTRADGMGACLARKHVALAGDDVPAGALAAAHKAVESEDGRQLTALAAHPHAPAGRSRRSRRSRVARCAPPPHFAIRCPNQPHARGGCAREQSREQSRTIPR
jgi:hypothetical protein